MWNIFAHSPLATDKIMNALNGAVHSAVQMKCNDELKSRKCYRLWMNKLFIT